MKSVISSVIVPIQNVQVREEQFKSMMEPVDKRRYLHLTVKSLTCLERFLMRIVTDHVLSTRREVMFSVCSHPGGGGGWLPDLHPIILPLVPCPFWGDTHLHPKILPLVPCAFRGYPSDWFQVKMGGTL